jgi:hypothetical protein
MGKDWSLLIAHFFARPTKKLKRTAKSRKFAVGSTLELWVGKKISEESLKNDS